MQPHDISWVICEAARATADTLRAELGDSRYQEVRIALKEFLCDYFSSVAACDNKLGKSISPVKCGMPGAKGLKVRFGYPGCGKSGGLRLAVLAFCQKRLVKIAGAWTRSVDPDDDDFDEAFKDS
ncbi:MAG: hypothetical protein K8J09_01990 [Planctomycetes bacterium]|nr:hypothetical protein [Planctomycetota bacterium]MCC7397622.1 hypothetical protein [Planctomycetota bacterium]